MRRHFPLLCHEVAAKGSADSEKGIEMALVSFGERRRREPCTRDGRASLDKNEFNLLWFEGTSRLCISSATLVPRTMKCL